ncbi:MAG: RnfABCDGE type electron transport complex subunit D, partial [Lentisphaeria bacterium]|nr:RnfABCDGE type electron transport complex subunit D [Lentisphaeria bacterium]
LESADALMQSFVGNVGGSLGETSALAILLGGIGLIVFRLIKWQIPFAIIGTTMIFTWLVNTVDPTLTPGPLFHICSGGLMLGAFFMATDMVTSPITHRGALLYGAMIGIITCVIRIWGAYPDGVSFAIVIMNALVPLIDRICYKRPFGWSPASASALQMRRGEVK